MSEFKKEKWFDAIEEATPLNGESGVSSDLGTILNSPIMLSALKAVLENKALSNEAFNKINFTTQDGVAHAIRLQGQGDGAMFVLDSLADLAIKDERDV